MKSISKRLGICAIALVGLFSIAVVNANSSLFSATIPAFQNWWYSSDGNGDGEITQGDVQYATVEIEAVSKDVNTVTFYVGPCVGDFCLYGDEGTIFKNFGHVSEGEDNWFIIPYPQQIPKGTAMGMKLRNHEYELSSPGTITGVVDYH